MKKIIELNETESALLSMWLQFAYESKHSLWCGGLSALEEAEPILRKRGLIKGNGQVYKNAEYKVK